MRGFVTLVFVILVLGAIALGSFVRACAVILSLRLRERSDRASAVVQLAAIAFALGFCGAAIVHRAWLPWEAAGVLSALILYRLANRYVRWTTE